LPPKTPLSGRCYCGHMRLKASDQPQVVTYCHCVDCRRVTGAPVGVFAAFDADHLTFEPPLDDGKSYVNGVTRWNCPQCCSPLAAQYPYLPGQIYLPIGLFDQAAELAPEAHSHSAQQLPWLHLQDDLPRSNGSGRGRLKEAAHD